MPAVTMRCPHCDRAYSVDGSLAGRTARCKGCKRSFALTPAAETAEPVDAPAAGGSPADPPVSPSRDASLPETIGRFVITGRLGSGGSGRVYRATDPILGREVAIKVPRRGSLGHPRAAERFLREARAAAQLRHPNIVTLFETGLDRGVPYLATELIDGSTLGATIGEGGIDPRRAAEIAAALAEALHFAHGQGIVHRDVKPANVLLDRQGQPHLMDFGLARIEGGAGGKLTQVGAIVGTPAYMAPEQAAGASEADAASDQYSLGATLYELLTGRTPFIGTPEVVIYNLTHGDAPPPRALNPAIPRDLETIVRKALARSPAERYASCRDLADDLGRWLRGESIRARRAGRIETARRWAMGHRRVAGAAALLVVAVLLVIGGWIALGRPERAPEPPAPADELTADGQSAGTVDKIPEPPPPAELADRLPATQPTPERKDRVVEASAPKPKESKPAPTPTAAPRAAPALTYEQRIQESYRACQEGRREAAEQLLDGCAAADRGWEWSFCRRLSRFHLATLQAKSGTMHCVAFSPDGRTLAAGGQDASVRIWGQKAPAGDPLFGHKLPVRRVAFLPDGTHLVSVGWEKEMLEIDRWDLGSPSKKPARFERTLRGLSAVEISGDARWVAAASANGTINIWSTEDFEEEPSIRQKFGKRTLCLAFGADGQNLFSSTSDGWSIHQRGAAKKAVGKPNTDAIRMLPNITQMALSPDGRYLAAATRDMVTLLDLSAKQRAWALDGDAGAVTTLAFSHDGRRIATAGNDNTVRVWETSSGAWKTSLLGHTSPLNRIDFGPDDGRIAGSSREGTIYAWRFDDGFAKRSVGLPNKKVFAADRLAFSANGGRLYAHGAHDLGVWDASDMTTIDFLRDVVTSSPDLRNIARRGGDGAIVLQDNEAGPQAAWVPSQFDATLIPHEPRRAEIHRLEDVVLLPGGRILFSVYRREETTGSNLPAGATWTTKGQTFVGVYGDFSYVGVWDDRRGGCVIGPLRQPGRLSAIDLIGATSEIIASRQIDQDTVIQILSPANFEAHQTFPATAYSIHPDGDLIALFRKGKIGIWSAKSRAFLSDGLIEGEVCAFDGPGKLIATRDKLRLRIWETATGRMVQEFTGTHLAFSPEGNRVFLGDTAALTVRDVASGRQVMNLGQGSRALAVSPDGRKLASLDEGSLTVYVADPPEASPLEGR